MNANTPLLPCPFCSGDMEDRGYGAIHVDGKGCPIGDHAISSDRWNRRALRSGSEALAKAVNRLRENLTSFDAEVAAELSTGGERADLWDEVNVNVEDLRAVLSALPAGGSQEREELTDGFLIAAAWHDARAKHTPSVFEQELHEKSAAAIRSLAAGTPLDEAGLAALSRPASPAGEGRVTGEIVEAAAKQLALDHISADDRAEYSWDDADRLWRASWRRKARNVLEAGLSALTPTAQEVALARRTGFSSTAVVSGWIVGDGDTKWRCWQDGMAAWSDDRDQATRYARREDAEAVHRDDEDAWTIEPYAAPVGAQEAGWRPIDENTPRDGTRVDLWLEPIDACESGNACRKTDAAFRDGTWCHYVPIVGWLNLEYHWFPTHWMPVPPAPSEGE